MNNITERQLQILEHLAEFKFLTSAQIMELLEVKTLPHVNQLLNKLGEGKHPLTKFKDLGFYPGVGRLARIHYLTKYGADFLVENLGLDPDFIKVSKERTPVFQRDYFHRVATIDFNVQFKKWCIKNDYEKLFFDYYFDQVGSQRQGTGKAKNSIPVGDFSIVPDGVGKFRTEKEDILFLFEHHNGKDTKRAIKQIIAHMQSIQEGAASEKYHYPKGVRVLYVFEHEACMRSVVRELYNTPEFKAFKDYFLFKTQDRINFEYDWMTFSGVHIHL